MEPLLTLTLDQIDELLPYYMNRLGLRDWGITTILRPQTDLRANAIAQIHWQLSLRHGTMSLADPKTRSENVSEPDMEISCVHELLHLCLAPITERVEDSTEGWTDLEERVCLEQPIVALSNSLVALRRATDHRFSWETTIINVENKAMPIQDGDPGPARA